MNRNSGPIERRRAARAGGSTKRRVMVPLATLALIAAATTHGLAAAAPDPQPISGLGSVLASLKPLSLAGVDRSFVPALADPDRSVSVMVEMRGEAVAVAAAAAREAGRAFPASARARVRDALTSAQGAILPDIKRLGGQVRSRLQHAYNGIRVRIPAGKAAELARLPGVVAVRPIPLAQTDNSSSVPFVPARPHPMPLRGFLRCCRGCRGLAHPVEQLGPLPTDLLGR